MSLPALPDDLRGLGLWRMLAQDQYSRAVSREVDALLLDAFKEITRRILGGPLALQDRTNLQRLFGQVSDLLAERYGSISSTLTVALDGFSEIERAIATAELEAILARGSGMTVSLGLLSPGRIIAAAEVLLEGRTMPQWWQAEAAKMTDIVRRQIQLGLTLGEGPRDIVRRILAPRAEFGTPMAYRTARRNATSLVRTAITGVSSETSFATYNAAGRHITSEYQWVAVRDARTTPICRALDGQRFRYDDPRAPRPPAHFNCRSTITPVIAGLPSGTPGGWRDYDAWLRAQSTTTQDRILGPARAELWRSGKATLQDMVDQDGRTVTLEQLRAFVATREDAHVAP